jgi:hypothetical protein
VRRRVFCAREFVTLAAAGITGHRIIAATNQRRRPCHRARTPSKFMAHVIDLSSMRWCRFVAAAALYTAPPDRSNGVRQRQARATVAMVALQQAFIGFAFRSRGAQASGPSSGC